jgi:hypothetical protein
MPPVDKKKERFERITIDAKGNLRDAWNRFVKSFQVVENYKSNIKQTRKLVSRMELEYLLKNNVCEIVFVRRRPERAIEKFKVRRMLCTNSHAILNSDRGRDILHYVSPVKGTNIDRQKHDLACAWDIFMQSYRNISISTPESPHTDKGPSKMTCYLRQVIPGDETFWKYYDDVLSKMSQEQKMSFIGWR